MSKLFLALYQSFLKIEKRIRFVISTAVLSFTLLVSTFFFFDKALIFMPIFIVVTYGCVYFSLLEGIERIEWVTLFIIPVLLIISFYFFYFLIPVRWITRIPFIVIFSICMYAALLASNIFNVGVEKNLQLYRAAFSINYFFQTLIMFFVANLIASLRLPFFENMVIFFLFASILSSHLFWTIKLELELSKERIAYGLLTGLIIGQTALLCSFVPLQPTIFALMLSSSYYVISGLIYLYLDQRLFKESVREYIFVLTFVFLLSIFTISW